MIKSDNEMVIEIRQFDIFWKEDSKTNPRNKKSLSLNLISRINHQMNRGEFSENENSENPKLRIKLTEIMILK